MPRWIAWIIRGIAIFLVAATAIAVFGAFNWFTEPIGRVPLWMALGMALFLWALTSKPKSDSES